jgi:hypothetical protein
LFGKRLVVPRKLEVLERWEVFPRWLGRLLSGKAWLSLIRKLKLGPGPPAD